MKKELFNNLVSQTKELMRQVWIQIDRNALNEQAIPSYLNPIDIVSDLFWQRVRVVIEELEKERPQKILDFGCGVDTLFLFFRELGISQVLAYDSSVEAYKGAKFFIEKNKIENIYLIEPDVGLLNIKNNSLDSITALDVLEHIPDLAVVLANFNRMLKNGGTLYVSGPTESFLYQLARKMGGEHYKKSYHVCNIIDIEREIQKKFDFRLLKKIYPIPTFFRVSKSIKK